jgi:hypothetical protein
MMDELKRNLETIEFFARRSEAQKRKRKSRWKVVGWSGTLTKGRTFRYR